MEQVVLNDEVKIYVWLSKHPNKVYTTQEIAKALGLEQFVVSSALANFAKTNTHITLKHEKGKLEFGWHWAAEHAEKTIERKPIVERYDIQGPIVEWLKTHPNLTCKAQGLVHLFEGKNIPKLNQRIGSTLIHLDKGKKYPRIVKVNRGTYVWNTKPTWIDTKATVRKVEPVTKTGRPKGKPILRNLVDFLQSNPDIALGLEKFVERFPDLPRSSISGSLAVMARGYEYPVERLSAGVYRWNSGGVTGSKGSVEKVWEKGNEALFVEGGSVWEGKRLR